MASTEDEIGILAAIREELAFAWHVVRCAFYVSVWRLKRLASDPKLIRGSKLVAPISALILFADILLFFLHKEMALWLGSFAVVILIPAAGVLTLHRLEEALSRETELSFTQQSEHWADALVEVAKSAQDQREMAVNTFVTKILSLISKDFADRMPTNVNLMFPGSDGKLRIVYLFPVGAKYDPNVCFEPGSGAAGLCFRDNKTVYVPSKRYMHGIIIKVPTASENGHKEITYGLRPRLYVPLSAEYEIYESILCIPLTSKKEKHGVMNIDSLRPDAFNIRDIHKLRAYARILGDGIYLGAKN